MHPEPNTTQLVIGGTLLIFGLVAFFVPSTQKDARPSENRWLKRWLSGSKTLSAFLFILVGLGTLIATLWPNSQ